MIMDKETPILVTGGTGFVGMYLLHWLVGQGYTQVTALHRKNSNFQLLEPIQSQIHWVLGDVTDAQTMFDVVAHQKVVIHTAGLVSFNPRDRYRLNEVNIEGTANIVNACIHYQIAKLIHLSSIAAIGKDYKAPFLTESTPWEDNKYVSHYAHSKFHGELEAWRGVAEGLNTIILNPSIILGAGYWDQTSCHLFQKVYQGLKFYTPGRTGFVDVRDVVKVIGYFLEHSSESGRYILNEDNYTFEHIFSTMADALSVKRPNIQPPKWLAQSMARLEEFKALLTGITPMITTDSIRNAFEAFNYSNEKVKNQTNINFNPINQTIEETCQLLKGQNPKKPSPALLPF